MFIVKLCGMTLDFLVWRDDRLDQIEFFLFAIVYDVIFHSILDIALYCIILYCIVLCYFMLDSTILYTT